VRWAYFDAEGVCQIITTVKATVLEFAHEKEVPDTYKPNTTRYNVATGEVEVFERPPLPPPEEVEPAWLTRVKALEERVKKLEHP